MSEDVMGALRLDGDRRAVHFERTYATDPEDLWSAITEPARLGRWLARVEGQFQLGGTFVLYFDDDDLDSRTIGQILECRPPERLRVSWYFRDEGESQVEIDLSATSDGTRMVLDHRRLPVSQATGYGAGWHAYLERLAGELTGVPPVRSWDAEFAALMPLYADLARDPGEGDGSPPS